MSGLPPLPLPGTWQLAQPEWLVLVAAAVVLPLLVFAARVRQSRRFARFADPAMHDTLAGRRIWWPVVCRSICAAGAAVLLGVAMSQPQSDPVERESDRTGRDVIFLLDVSRSMLATDVAPNRLERAKLWISDLVRELKGDRFALVAFAGSASVRAPLSNDRLFFSLMLDELSPASVSRGGTNIGDAIRKTMELVVPPRNDDSANTYTDIILITDGEDQESLPVAAAQAAAQRGVRIIAIGIGSEGGTAIPTSENSQQTVTTRLESSTLRDIAGATPGGVYIEVGTGTVDLPSLYRDIIAAAGSTSLERATSLQYSERFLWFLWPAVLLLIAERVLIPSEDRQPVVRSRSV
ncbi:MAG: VWA domain-containing protein [Planctomycetota bacterium]|nr:MAG: VWA domain-containing protein [Planctomycetota bacterium]